MLAHGRRGLFLFFLDFHWLKVFGLENLPAIEAFDVIHPVSSGDDLGTIVLASGLHNQRLDETYSIQPQKLVKYPQDHIDSFYDCTSAVPWPNPDRQSPTTRYNP